MVRTSPSSRVSSKSSTVKKVPSSKGRYARPPGWFCAQAKRSQTRRSAPDASYELPPPVPDVDQGPVGGSPPPVDSHDTGVEGVDHGAGPSSPTPPPSEDMEAGPSASPSPSRRYSPHHGLESLSSSSSDEEDDDEVTRTEVGNGEDVPLNGEGGEREKGSSNGSNPPPVDSHDTGVEGGNGGHSGPHGGDGLMGTPGHAGNQGPPQSTPHNLQARPPTLDVSPTEDARNLDTHSG